MQRRLLEASPAKNKIAISKGMVVGFLALVCIVIATVSYFTFFKLGSTSPPESSPTPPATKPDLEISNIGTEPYPPKVGELFFIQVRVTNIGEAKSGSYKLDVLIHDKTHQYTYAIAGHVDQGPLEPGEDRLWDKWIPVGGELKLEGYHTLYAEVTPVGFEDGDTSNNKFESSQLLVTLP